MNKPMHPKKVLVVGMFDSIHFARWINQFKEIDSLEILLFPSKKFRLLNSELRKVISDSKNIKIANKKDFLPCFTIGYIDFLKFEFLKNFKYRFSLISRSKYLNKVIMEYRPEIIHAVEIQGAGYLVMNALGQNNFKCKTILTNYGSDIFYFSKKEEHLVDIKKCLNFFEFYSAECQRDYEIALSYGFTGKFMPIVPNAGGVRQQDLDFPVIRTSKRTKIAVKAYGGEFGLGETALEICARILSKNYLNEFYFYSVTDDLLPKVLKLKENFPDQIHFSTVSKKLPYEEMIALFRQSRCYLGMSKSDGISTSFLEALSFGAYPIQTDTSCASEWVEIGAVGSIVSISDLSMVERELERAIFDDKLVDDAQSKNFQIASKFLNYDFIKERAEIFYS
jgi:glycosyltransferase involved in cell wall biosynthesis